MDKYIYIGNTSFTQEGVAALDKAIEDVQRSNALSYGIYALLEGRARSDPNHPEFYQDQIDTYLEAKGLKSPKTVIPPRILAGSYRLDEKYGKAGRFLPEWWTRGDGAILYRRQWWGTTAPVNGWHEYAWFQVKSALDYEQVSEWKPIEHYIHKR